MEIRQINEYRVEVALSPEEMDRLGVSFDALDWSDIETRRAVWSVLDVVRERGVELDLSGKVLIEASRGAENVRLCFSVLPQRGAGVSMKSLVKSGGAVLLRAGTRRDLLAAAERMPDNIR